MIQSPLEGLNGLDVGLSRLMAEWTLEGLLGLFGTYL